LLTLNGIYLICNIDNKDKNNNKGLLLYIQSLEDNILNKFSKEKIKTIKYESISIIILLILIILKIMKIIQNIY